MATFSESGRCLLIDSPEVFGICPDLSGLGKNFLSPASFLASPYFLVPVRFCAVSLKQPRVFHLQFGISPYFFYFQREHTCRTDALTCELANTVTCLHCRTVTGKSFRSRTNFSGLTIFFWEFRHILSVLAKSF